MSSSYQVIVVIIVLMCKGTLSICTCPSNTVQSEKYLSPIVLPVGLNGQQQCMKECLSRPGLCRGVNYKKADLLCELITSTNRTEMDPEYSRITADKVHIFLFDLLWSSVKQDLFVIGVAEGRGHTFEDIEHFGIVIQIYVL
jgi:hypothetical protein